MPQSYFPAKVSPAQSFLSFSCHELNILFHSTIFPFRLALDHQTQLHEIPRIYGVFVDVM
jgi:hypothetical protein